MYARVCVHLGVYARVRVCLCERSLAEKRTTVLRLAETSQRTRIWSAAAAGGQLWVVRKKTETLCHVDVADLERKG